jgi:uncharacterized protein (DUF58 family)
MGENKKSLSRASDFTDPDYFLRRLREPKSFVGLLEAVFVPPNAQRTKPTSAGWILIIVSMGLGGAAYNNASNILFIALALLLSSLVLSGILSTANFKKIDWELILPQHMRVGETAPIRVKLENHKRFLPTFSVHFTTFADDAPSQTLYLEERLPPRGEAEIDWMHEPQQRGHTQLGISGLVSLYPFGFLKKVAGRGVTEEALVWPPRIEYEHLGGLGRAAASTESKSKRPGQGGDLLNLREYRRGDPPRDVHWKATARTRRLMVRQDTEEQRQRFTLFIETPIELWGDPERLDRLCALSGSLAEDLFHRGQLAAYAINDQPAQTVTRQSDLHNLFDELALLGPVQGYRSIHPPGGEAGGVHLITFHPEGGKEVYARIGGNRAATPLA